MIFAEKLVRATAEQNKAKVSRAAGLPPTAISNYITKKQLPRADTALALARALGVPLEWLIDDAQDWPPPNPRTDAKPATMLTDSDLMREVLRRRRLALAELLEKLKRAETIDWPDVHRRLAGIPPGGSIPRDLAADALLVYALFASHATAFRQFDLKFYQGLYRQMLPSGVEKPEDLDDEQLMERVLKVLGNPAFDAVMKEVEKRPSMRTAQERTDMLAWGTLARVAAGEISLRDAEQQWLRGRRKKKTPTKRKR
jgi:transcriptional regulator with XRE-family HTH domain